MRKAGAPLLSALDRAQLRAVDSEEDRPAGPGDEADGPAGPGEEAAPGPGEEAAPGEPAAPDPGGGDQARAGT